MRYLAVGAVPRGNEISAASVDWTSVRWSRKGVRERSEPKQERTYRV